MKILAWTLGFWHVEQDAHRFEAGWSSFKYWHERVQYLFHPIECFIASGTWSEPKWAPIPVTVVNAGCIFTGVYEGVHRHYGKAAFTAAMAYALNRNDWDLLVTLDTDGLVGDVDFQVLLTEFLARPECLLAPGWCGYPGGPFMAMKREAASRLLHRRQCGNIYDDPDDTAPPPTLWEQECYHIFRPNGDTPRWWNPWPAIRSMADEWDDPVANNWPFIRKPHATKTVPRYMAEKCILAKPVLCLPSTPS